MSESWEQTKYRLKKQGIFTKKEIKIKETKTAQEVEVPLYEIRKITLPVNPNYPQGKVVVLAIPEKEANWWITEKLKAKTYDDDLRGFKTLVFYEKFLMGASPKERNIYSNPARFCTEDTNKYR